ncbi:IS5 family transposase [Cupriavidus sp. TA19]|nr:IS5 family transposase [Cupriavidus sp. TA19]
MVFETLVDAIPAVPGLPGRPRSRPDKLHAGKGYDFARCRRHLRKWGISPRIVRRGVEENDRLGKHRCALERTHAWLAGFGKLRIRFERRLDIRLAVLKLACAVICSRFVEGFC